MDKKTLELQAHLPFSFHHKVHEDDEKLVLFLHGYMDSGMSFFRRALRGNEISESILAPNGPFPLPVQTEDSFKEAYAWYFWEYSKNRVVIPPRVSVGLLKELIDQLGYTKKPKVLVGFSQGGFMLPYLLPELEGIKGLVAVGAGFREQDYPASTAVPLVAIHGDEDKIIGLDYSQKSFEALLATRKIKGDFHIIPGLGHTVNEAGSLLIRDSIKSLFARP